MVSLIYAWINGRVKDCEAGDLRRHRTHYDVIVMSRSLTINNVVLKSTRNLIMNYHFPNDISVASGL